MRPAGCHSAAPQAAIYASNTRISYRHTSRYPSVHRISQLQFSSVLQHAFLYPKPQAFGFPSSRATISAPSQASLRLPASTRRSCSFKPSARLIQRNTPDGLNQDTRTRITMLLQRTKLPALNLSSPSVLRCPLALRALKSSPVTSTFQNLLLPCLGSCPTLSYSSQRDIITTLRHLLLSAFGSQDFSQASALLLFFKTLSVLRISQPLPDTHSLCFQIYQQRQCPAQHSSASRKNHVSTPPPQTPVLAIFQPAQSAQPPAFFHLAAIHNHPTGQYPNTYSPANGTSMTTCARSPLCPSRPWT